MATRCSLCGCDTDLRPEAAICNPCCDKPDALLARALNAEKRAHDAEVRLAKRDKELTAARRERNEARVGWARLHDAALHTVGGEGGPAMNWWACLECDNDLFDEYEPGIVESACPACRPLRQALKDAKYMLPASAFADARGEYDDVDDGGRRHTPKCECTKCRPARKRTTPSEPSRG